MTWLAFILVLAVVLAALVLGHAIAGELSQTLTAAQA